MVIYVIFGVVLLIGVVCDRVLFKYLFEVVFDGLDDVGWMIFFCNWGVFFLVLVVLNEGFCYFFSFGGWLEIKFYVFLLLLFFFIFVYMLMLLCYGLGVEVKDEVVIYLLYE